MAVHSRIVACLALAMLVNTEAWPDPLGVNKVSALVQGNNALDAQTRQRESQSIEDRILIAVSKLVRKDHLTERPDECLAYRLDSSTSKNAYLVEVRESHRRASCGGDPRTEPRLFTVKVNKKTMEMSTDQGSPGQFHSLKE